eukprot:5326942-Pleurochrysis_carterae.AAC.2
MSTRTYTFAVRVFACSFAVPLGLPTLVLFLPPASLPLAPPLSLALALALPLLYTLPSRLLPLSPPLQQGARNVQTRPLGSSLRCAGRLRPVCCQLRGYACERMRAHACVRI